MRVPQTPDGRLITIVAAALGCLVVPLVSAKVASACQPSVGLPNLHCYELAEWSNSKSGQMEGQFNYIESSQFNALSLPDRMQNEAWTIFTATGGGWVEAGETTGLLYGGQYVSSPVYFYAAAWDRFGHGYTEWDLPNGPGLGQWFSVETAAAGSNVWCWWINGAQQACWVGLQTYADGGQQGLEVAGNIPPDPVTESGTAMGYYLPATANPSWALWSNVDNKATTTPGVSWCYQWPVNGYESVINTGTGNAPCAPGQTATH